MRAKQFNQIGGHAHRVVHSVGDFGRDALRVPPVAHFSRDDQPFGSAARIRGAKRDDAAGAHAGNSARNVLNFVRIQVAAGLDDHVFRAPCDVDLSVGHVGAVA